MMIAALRRFRLHRPMLSIATGASFPIQPYRRRNIVSFAAANDQTLDSNSHSTLLTIDSKLACIPKRIVFGSCSSQSGDLSYWDRITEQNPDLIVLMGDNVYPPAMNKNFDQTGATISGITMSSAYKTLASNPSFIRAINKRIPIIATLDDNDYNFRYFQHATNHHHRMFSKEAIQNELEVTKKEFLHFFRIPSTDDRWTQSGRGVYTSYDFCSYQNGLVKMSCSTDTESKGSVNSDDGNVLWRLQIILLDVRRHKSPFALQDTYNSNDEKCTGPYIPSYDKHHTMLGACQWKWLEEQLDYQNGIPPPPSPMVSATKAMHHKNNKVIDDHAINKEPNLRIIVSPIQVLSDGRHGWDCWSLFPRERERLLSLLWQESASSTRTLPNNEEPPNIIPTIVLSGDRHVAGFYRREMCRDRNNDASNNHHSGTVTEVTSSSLTHSVPVGLLDHEVDTKRAGNFVYGNNFGVLQINNVTTTTTDDIDLKDDTISIGLHCAKTGMQLDCATVNF